MQSTHFVLWITRTRSLVFLRHVGILFFSRAIWFSDRGKSRKVWDLGNIVVIGPRWYGARSSKAAQSALNGQVVMVERPRTGHMQFYFIIRWTAFSNPNFKIDHGSTSCLQSDQVNLTLNEAHPCRRSKLPTNYVAILFCLRDVTSVLGRMVDSSNYISPVMGIIISVMKKKAKKKTP